MATEVSEAASATNAAAAPDGKMNSLLAKLSSITDASPSASSNEMIKSSKKPYQKRSSSSYTNNNKDENRQARKNVSRQKNSSNSGPQRRSFNNNRNNNNNDNSGNNQSFRRNNAPRERQTVSHFDKIRNSKKSSPVITKSEAALNESGLSFADLQEQKALYIRRKLNAQSNIEINTPVKAVHDFITSRVKHRNQIYDPISAQFSEFKGANNTFKLKTVNQAELELSKDHMGYSTESRLLRAMEQLTRKRGFKLFDAEKNNSQYLPLNANIYPYANTTLPNNLARPFANLKNLSNISKEEIRFTLATVVKGERQELVVDPNTKFPTEQAKVNAYVVVNNLNRNAQLQVDNLHQSMAPVMLGNAPVKQLPQPIIAPKKI